MVIRRNKSMKREPEHSFGRLLSFGIGDILATLTRVSDSVMQRATKG